MGPVYGPSLHDDCADRAFALILARFLVEALGKLLGIPQVKPSNNPAISTDEIPLASEMPMP
jgi:hypothetical protein